MPFYTLTLAALCVWRITHLLQAEDGPYDLVVRLRRALGNGLLGKLLDCFYCLSLWIAAPFAAWLGASTQERWLLWPALSAAAILLERITARAASAPSTPAPAAEPYWKEDESDVVLREATNKS